MLYITIGNAIVYLMSEIAGNYVLFDALCFNRDLILQGQVWRLFSCVFTSVFGYGNILFVAVGFVITLWAEPSKISGVHSALIFSTSAGFL